MNHMPISVRRHISSSILYQPDLVQKVIPILANLPGVIEAMIDRSGKRVVVCYDITQLNYGDLIQLLKEKRLTKNYNWWQKLKVSWWRDVDITTRENATSKSSSCCGNPTCAKVQCQKNKNR